MGSGGAPKLFRVLVAATDLDRSRRFYEELLGVRGRTVAPGRIYFDCGPVILGVLDFSRPGAGVHAVPTEALYLSTESLEEIHARAKRLGALSQELIHNDPRSPAGEIVERPWGERSFYVEDPAGNPLCFVDARTKFTGTPRQVAALTRGEGPARSPRPRRTRSTSARRKTTR